MGGRAVPFPCSRRSVSPVLVSPRACDDEETHAISHGHCHACARLWLNHSQKRAARVSSAAA
eukprot:1251088-Rhodomonas_salina.1